MGELEEVAVDLDQKGYTIMAHRVRESRDSLLRFFSDVTSERDTYRDYLKVDEAGVHRDWIADLQQSEEYAEELRKALRGLVLDCQDYEAWQRPCHALHVAKVALDKNPNPAGQTTAEPSPAKAGTPDPAVTNEDSGPVG
ncbi:hypothetical protein KW797_03265, partial [Candidatus Parcubacteria bacterium]|nr:hypothetical protein [Candidatus Parcubacteria bacterium]